MSRSSALIRLAVAYGRHQLRNRFRSGAGGEDGDRLLLESYAADRLVPLSPDERSMLPAVAGCIGCGLCAVAAGRVGGLAASDLASAYLRDYPALAGEAGEVAPSGRAGVSTGERSALEAAAAICPTGVPLPGVLEMIRRLATA